MARATKKGGFPALMPRSNPPNPAKGLQRGNTHDKAITPSVSITKKNFGGSGILFQRASRTK